MATAALAAAALSGGCVAYPAYEGPVYYGPPVAVVPPPVVVYHEGYYGGYRRHYGWHGPYRHW
ncbi:MAG: hypothetical protein E6R07_07775 [Nevskiaceae bacterium]|nr:MAG: hypothetical protein E6R07_07775 [Nevskiaceae bacterium]